MNFPIISFVTFFPLAGAILLIFLNREKKNFLLSFAFVFSLINFIASLFLYFNFNSQTPNPQFVEKAPGAVVEKTRAEHAELERQAEALRARVASLQGR